MNILIIAAFDSANYVYPNLIKELKKRGHKYYVVIANKYDSVNYKMLIENHIELIYHENITNKILDTIDIAYIPANPGNGNFGRLLKRIKLKNIFTFSLLHLNLTSYTSENVDLVMCMGQNSADYSYFCGFKYPCINIGNPQYDNLIVKRKKHIRLNKIKKVMIIEQGAYPCGDIGKQQFADALVAIARNNPTIKFVVKPRYTPSESNDIPHPFKKHFYKYITDCPENLVLQRNYVALENMIKDFDAVITLCSTGYLDAALYGLPVIFLKGFTSEEVFNLPKANFDRMYAQLDKFGTVINYKEVIDNPLDFHYLDSDELERTVYRHTAPASSRMVDLLEFIKKNYIDKNLRFKSGFVMDYDDFVSKKQNIETISLNDSKYELHKKYLNNLNRVFSKLAFRNRCLKWALNTSELVQYWNINVTDDMTRESLDKIIDNLNDDVKTLIFKWFDEHNDLLVSDVVIQHYYFTFLYEYKKYDDVLNYNGPLVAPESLEHYKFKIHMITGDFEQAMYEYVKFRNYCDRKPIVNLPVDTTYGVPIIMDKAFLTKENLTIRNKFFGYIFRLQISIGTCNFSQRINNLMI